VIIFSLCFCWISADALAIKKTDVSDDVAAPQTKKNWANRNISPQFGNLSPIKFTAAQNDSTHSPSPSTAHNTFFDDGNGNDGDDDDDEEIVLSIPAARLVANTSLSPIAPVHGCEEQPAAATLKKNGIALKARVYAQGEGADI
jgi:hypothetical protein